MLKEDAFPTVKLLVDAVSGRLAFKTEVDIALEEVPLEAKSSAEIKPCFLYMKDM